MATKIIVSFKEPVLSDLLLFSLQSEHFFDVIECEAGSNILDTLNEDSEIQLLLLDSMLGEGVRDLVQKSLANYDVSIPFVYLKGKDIFVYHGKSGELIDQYINCSEILKQLSIIISKYFEKEKKSSTKEYAPLAIRTLVRFAGLQDPVYIKLSEKKYIKLFLEGDKIVINDVERFQSKGVKNLYVLKIVHNWLLKQLDEYVSKSIDQGSFDVPIEIKKMPEDYRGSEDTTLSGPEHSFNDLDELIIEESEEELLEEIKNLEDQVKLFELDEEVTFDDIAEKVTISEEMRTGIQKTTKRTIGLMKKSKSITKLFNKLSKSLGKQDFYIKHIHMTATIACAIAKQLGWFQAATMEKLVFVAHIHDIAFAEFPHLSEISSQSEFEEKKEGLTKVEQDLYLHHSQIASDLISEMEVAPQDADKIILQHHEQPDGSGFPNQIRVARIIPMAALFIVAHDLTHYIVKNEDWSPQEYALLAHKKFVGGNFRKIIEAVNELK